MEKMLNIYVSIIIILQNLLFTAFWFLGAGIGVLSVVFGLGTPLDHPPETTQWVTAWAGGLYILYIYRGDGVPG